MFCEAEYLLLLTLFFKQKSFEIARERYTYIKSANYNDWSVILVGNKLDLKSQREVPFDVFFQLLGRIFSHFLFRWQQILHIHRTWYIMSSSEQYLILKAQVYVETSGKYNVNADTPFLEGARMVLAKQMYTYQVKYKESKERQQKRKQQKKEWGLIKLINRAYNHLSKDG